MFDRTVFEQIGESDIPLLKMGLPLGFGTHSQAADLYATSSPFVFSK